jgi:DNA-binding transcriptional LysR family regulator
MDRLHAMEVFVAAAAAGSFARATARLRISPPAVTRAIAALETRLGARLFARTTRRLSLTEAGARFLASSQRLLADLDAAEKVAVGDASAPHGHLMLTAPVTLGRIALPAILGAFQRAQPQISVSALLLDRVVDLIEEGLDVGLRIGQLRDSSLIARRVGSVRRVLVASPGYLAAKGTPRTPADLSRHAIIAFTPLMPGRELRLGPRMRGGSVALSPRLEINDAGAAIAAAEFGEGITIAVSYQVAQSVRDGRLATVLDRFMPPHMPVHIVHPQGRLVAPKIRAFVDFAAPRLRAALTGLAA